MLANVPTASWVLDPQLAKDTATIGDLPLCRVVLIRDATYPWLLLVPRQRDAVEIIDLDTIAQAQLMTEVAHASRVLKTYSGCDKINVAALGNVVAQLHVHVIARSRGDAAWPRPVWNAAPPRDYDRLVLQERIETLREKLSLKPL